MFVCEPCHDKGTCQRGFIEGLMRSRGPCETCGQVAACLDCHGYKRTPEARALADAFDLPDVLHEEADDDR